MREGMATPAIDGLPPFQGGLAGLLSYDLNRRLERIAAPRFDEFFTLVGPVQAGGDEDSDLRPRDAGLL